MVSTASSEATDGEWAQLYRYHLANKFLNQRELAQWDKDLKFQRWQIITNNIPKFENRQKALQYNPYVLAGIHTILQAWPKVPEETICRCWREAHLRLEDPVEPFRLANGNPQYELNPFMSPFGCNCVPCQPSSSLTNKTYNVLLSLQKNIFLNVNLISLLEKLLLPTHLRLIILTKILEPLPTPLMTQNHSQSGSQPGIRGSSALCYSDRSQYCTPTTNR